KVTALMPGYASRQSASKPRTYASIAWSSGRESFEASSQLGRHKARCVAVRLLMPPVENRTYHFHGIRLSTCGPSPCAHDAFLPISPAPQCFPRGQLARSLGTSGPVFPQARGLRQESSSSCGQLSCPPTTMPLPTSQEGIGFSYGSRLPTSTILIILPGLSRV